MIRRRSKSATRRRREAARSWLPPLRRLGTALAVLLTVGAVLFVLRLALNQPVERVVVSGRIQRVQVPDVEKAVRRAVADSGMAGLDLARVAREIESIAWVDRASVARSWPRALTVQVVEQAPVARWGESGLLNTRGQLFVYDLRHIPPELPELAGPEGQQAQMTALLLAAAPRLTAAGMRLTRLTLDARGAWEMQLDNGVTLRLGREQVEERFERFIRAAARTVAARSAEIAYVDLRYANGFAVGWRTGAGGAASGKA